MSEDTSPDPHPDSPDSPSGQPYSAPRQAWGGNADPRNLSYEPEGLRYFGPGYEQPNDVPWDGRPPQSSARADGAAELRADLELLEFVGCQFWACEGPDVPPQDMVTCRVCRRISELRSLLGIPS